MKRILLILIILLAPTVFLGSSLPEHAYHAKSEKFDWRMASGGVKLFVRYFDAVSRLAL